MYQKLIATAVFLLITLALSDKRTPAAVTVAAIVVALQPSLPPNCERLRVT